MARTGGAARVVVLVVAGVVVFAAIGCREPAPVVVLRPPEIIYPRDGTVFPPDIAPPTFRWKGAGDAETWSISIGDESTGDIVTARTRAERWTPSPEQWAAVLEMSREKATKVAVRGHLMSAPDSPSPPAVVTITTSRDEVGAPLFYREVNLPFIDAVKDPTKIRWRFGSISSLEPPPIVLEKLPVCGNCHSFSRDGQVIGMDVDYANDKGSYVITDVAQDVFLDREHIITWADYQRTEDRDPTFGLLSQVSPDGRYVASTVNDRSVFVPRPGLEFSQLFFPIKGIIVVYDRQEKAFRALPGADDPAYVQSNPTWSPDGEQVVFAKNRAHQLKNVGHQVLISVEDAREFIDGRKLFRFDLYRVPFNGGGGGTPEPIEGASNNGTSNFFPRFSPDGRWIVFCKANSFMLLQPDSELYIMPAAGGEPRRMQCNLPRMNSWHSWSPNGRWLVFSSKPDGPYTQMFLTHIDDEGNSTPAVALDRMVAPQRAVNIPEFVSVTPDAIHKIHEAFVDEYSYIRAGNEALEAKAPDLAERAYRKAVEMNPESSDANNNLGFLLMRTGRSDEARPLLERAVKLEPDSAAANNNLGALLLLAGELETAESVLSKYVKARPDDFAALSNLGYAEERLGKIPQARAHYEKALFYRPDHAPAHCNMGDLLTKLGELEAARPHLEKCESAPEASGAAPTLR
jgi:Flp pilus assembly protein TadD/Tol biopolymer transport system component